MWTDLGRALRRSGGGGETVHLPSVAPALLKRGGRTEAPPTLVWSALLFEWRCGKPPRTRSEKAPARPWEGAGGQEGCSSCRGSHTRRARTASRAHPPSHSEESFADYLARDLLLTTHLHPSRGRLHPLLYLNAPPRAIIAFAPAVCYSPIVVWRPSSPCPSDSTCGTQTL